MIKLVECIKLVKWIIVTYNLILTYEQAEMHFHGPRNDKNKK